MEEKYKKIAIIITIVLLLCCCISFITIFSTIGWLNSHNVYSSRMQIAEVNISEQRQDEQGEFAEVKVRFVQQPSALSFIFGRTSSNNTLGNEETYKVYGDTVYISGPILRTNKGAFLINFDSMYKVTSIYGTNELSTKESRASNISINGGSDDYERIFNDIKSGSITGSFYKGIIKSSEISSAGVFVGEESKDYSIFITSNGFIWELNE